YGIIIFDQGIHDGLVSHEDFKNLNEMKAFKKGDSIEELAEELGINKLQLKETYLSFQQNNDGKADQFNRTNFPKQLKTPLYGIKVVPALFHTQGGLKMNENAQVMSEHAEGIENLYAGGGTAVGVSGNRAYCCMCGY